MLRCLIEHRDEIKNDQCKQEVGKSATVHCCCGAVQCG